MLRRAMTALLALALLAGLAPVAPALAMERLAAPDDDCCSSAVLQICQQSSPSATDQLQTASFAGAVADAGWRDAIAPQTASRVARPTGPPITGGPPVYLLYHRLLL